MVSNTALKSWLWRQREMSHRIRPLVISCVCAALRQLPPISAHRCDRHLNLSQNKDKLPTSSGLTNHPVAHVNILFTLHHSNLHPLARPLSSNWNTRCRHTPVFHPSSRSESTATYLCSLTQPPAPLLAHWPGVYPQTRASNGGSHQLLPTRCLPSTLYKTPHSVALPSHEFSNLASSWSVNLPHSEQTCWALSPNRQAPPASREIMITHLLN